MYCLKVSLLCIHWSSSSHFAKMESTETAYGKGGRGGRVEEEHEGGKKILTREGSSARVVVIVRTSRFPRIPDFLAFTKYKWDPRYGNFLRKHEIRRRILSNAITDKKQREILFVRGEKHVKGRERKEVKEQR